MKHFLWFFIRAPSIIDGADVEVLELLTERPSVCDTKSDRPFFHPELTSNLSFIDSFKMIEQSKKNGKRRFPDVEGWEKVDLIVEKPYSSIGRTFDKSAPLDWPLQPISQGALFYSLIVWDLCEKNQAYAKSKI